jgi:hypothetical protein
MKTCAVSLAAAVSLTAAALPSATAAPRTTTPGVVYIVPVVITDKSIAIKRDKFTLNGQTRFPRGALIRFSVLNKGTRPYAFRIWGDDTAVIKPGKHGTILVNWNYRGRFAYSIVLGGKPAGPKGTIVIF